MQLKWTVSKPLVPLLKLASSPRLSITPNPVTVPRKPSPTNLAEDAELAIRLRIAKWNVAAMDARHWEEAPVTFNAWLKQGTRRFRGWMQSFWKYSSVIFKPTVVRHMGLSGVFSTFLMLISPLIVVLNWIAYSVTAYWALEVAGIPPQVTAGDPFLEDNPALIQCVVLLHLDKGCQT